MSRNTYRVDTTHSGLRLVSLAAALIGALLASFVIVPSLARVLGASESLDVLLSCIGGPAIGLGAGWAVERYLRVVWPSGRWLKVDEEGVTLHERSGELTPIKWAEPVDVLWWHFVIRGARMWVPQGWYCVACRLAQGDKVIAPYAFMRPTDARALANWESFPELISRKQAHDERRRKQAEAQEHLRAAEEDRWSNGAEMTPADFASLLAELDRQLADRLGGIA